MANYTPEDIALQTPDDKNLKGHDLFIETLTKGDDRNDMNRPLVSAFAGQTGLQVFRTFRRVYLICCAVSLGGMYAGYCGAAAGNIVANPGFIAQMATLADPLTGAPVLDAKHVSFWGGFFYVGQVALQLLAPLISDRYGRKACMWSLIFLMLLAIVLQIVSKDWKMFLGAKILGGGSTAFVGAAILSYMSEIAPAPIRGATLAVFSFSFALGQFFNAVALQILNITTPLAFRNVFYSEFVMLGVFVPIVILVPESPVWLCMQGRHEQALAALRKVIGNVEGYDHQLEYSVIKSETEESIRVTALQGEQQWVALLRWASFKRVIAAAIPLTLQNFVGVPLVFGYTTYFLQLAGLENPFIGVVIIYCLLLVGIGASFFVVERFGRRQLLLLSCLAMALIDAAIGGIGFKEITPALGNGLVALCSIWVFTYALSLAPLGYISLVELSSPALRAKTSAVAMFGQSLSGLTLFYVVPFMLSPQYAGWETKIGLFFAGTSLLGLIPTYFLFPETKGRTYGALDDLYARGVPPRKFATMTSSVEGDEPTLAQA